MMVFYLSNLYSTMNNLVKLDVLLRSTKVFLMSLNMKKRLS